MPRPTIRLYVRISSIYAIVSIISAIAMLLSDRYVSGYGPNDTYFSLIFTFGAFAGWYFTAALYTKRRLNRIRDRLDAAAEERIDAGAGKEAFHTWDVLIRLPFEIFWMFAVYGFTMSQVYHIIALNRIASPQPLMEYVKALLFSLTTMPGIALVYFGLLRMVIKPYLPMLPIADTRLIRFKSFSSPMMAAFVCAILFAVFRIGGNVVQAEIYGEPVHMETLLSIALAAAILCSVAYVILNASFLRELRDMIGKLRHAIRFRDEALHRSIPIVSRYEPGELAMVYNELQGRLAREYEQLEKERRLAANVQRRIMHSGTVEAGSVRAWGEYRESSGIGSHFYDAVKLDDSRIAVTAGHVAGSGLSAALVMSAFLAWFRTESGTGSAGDIWSRINVRMNELGQGRFAIHAALGVVNSDTGIIDFVCAGSANALLNAKPVVIEPAPPLGMTEYGPFRSRCISLSPGKRFGLSGKGATGESTIWVEWSGIPGREDEHD